MPRKISNSTFLKIIDLFCVCGASCSHLRLDLATHLRLLTLFLAFSHVFTSAETSYVSLGLGCRHSYLPLDACQGRVVVVGSVREPAGFDGLLECRVYLAGRAVWNRRVPWRVKDLFTFTLNAKSRNQINTSSEIDLL